MFNSNKIEFSDFFLKEYNEKSSTYKQLFFGYITNWQFEIGTFFGCESHYDFFIRVPHLGLEKL